MGTRRSRHNRGRKPLYKEHRQNLVDPNIDGPHSLCGRCGVPSWGKLCRDCYQRGSAFLHSERAKALDAEAVRGLSEEAAFVLFQQIRWQETDGRPVCPKCDSQDCYERHTRRASQCKACDHVFSVLSGTPFESSKKGYVGVLLAVASFAHSGGHLATLRRAEECGLTPKAAVQIEQRVRRALEPSRPPQSFVLGRGRYMGNAWMSTRTWWTDAEKDALRRFAAQGASPVACADALGRSPTSLLAYGRELKIQFPASWLTAIRKPRRRREIKVDLQYPYVVKPRDEHADLLAVNDLVPKGLPPTIRADVCQEVMLALFEGKITLDALKAHKGKMRWFVAQFYKNNFEDGGHAVSLAGQEDDDRSYYEIAGAMAVRDAQWGALNDARHQHESFTRFSPATQEDDVYDKQTLYHQAGLHAQDRLFDFQQARDDLEGVDPHTGRHLTGFHGAQRALQRYGIKLTPEILLDIKRQIHSGEAKTIHMRLSLLEASMLAKIVLINGKQVPVIWNWRDSFLVTVLPVEQIQDEKKRLVQTTRAPTAREMAEGHFR